MEHKRGDFKEKKNLSKFAAELLSLNLGYNTLSYHALLEILIKTTIGPY